MTNDIDIYPHWYQFKYRDMRQTKWAFELKRLGKFLHLLFLKPINFKILELSIKYIKKYDTNFGIEPKETPLLL